MNDLDVGEVFVSDKVLLIGGVEQTVVGRPFVPSAHVEVTVEEHLHLPKVLTFKKRRRKNSQRIKGKRPQVTLLRVNKIHFDEQQPLMQLNTSATKATATVASTS